MNENEIHPELKKHLDALNSLHPRDPDRVAEGRAEFLSVAQYLKEQRAMSPMERIREWFVSALRMKNKSWAVALVSLLVVLVVALGSVGGTVYAAHGSIPGQALYPVKIFTENVRLRLETEPQDRIDLHASFAEERIWEIEELFERDLTVPDDLLLMLEQHAESMMQEGTNVEDPELEMTLNKLQLLLEKQIALMNRIQSEHPAGQGIGLDWVQEKYQLRLQFLESTLNSPQEFKEEMEKGKPVRPDAPGKPEKTPKPTKEKPEKEEKDQDNPGRGDDPPRNQDNPGRGDDPPRNQDNH